jgi:uncharacterized protein YdeI (YjbR/CyaY-like superfamily)
MGKRDPRFDAYIEKQADFARPILEHVREVVHAACPDVVETMKWSSPSYEYKGILCGMAAFKQHAVFGFWKHELVVGAMDAKAKEAMGSFGRLQKVSDLPSKAQLTRMVKKAMQLNDEGVKAVRQKTGPRKTYAMHPDFKAALSRNKKARATYDEFSPSHQREYLEWIGEAKGDETRERRIATSVEWLAEGKSRNWKYQRAK